MQVLKMKLPPRPRQRTPDSKISLAHDYNGSVDHLLTEAANVASAATRIVQMVTEAKSKAAKGEAEVAVTVNPQMLFLTGAVHRLLKDWAVVEHMQARGARMHRRPGDTR